MFKLVQEKLSISIENIEETEEKQCSVVSEAMGESGARKTARKALASQT